MQERIYFQTVGPVKEREGLSPSLSPFSRSLSLGRWDAESKTVTRPAKLKRGFEFMQ